jgi:hypothetical protein
MGATIAAASPNVNRHNAPQTMQAMILPPFPSVKDKILFFGSRKYSTTLNKIK